MSVSEVDKREKTKINTNSDTLDAIYSTAKNLTNLTNVPNNNTINNNPKIRIDNFDLRKLEEALSEEQKSARTNEKSDKNLNLHKKSKSNSGQQAKSDMVGE